MSVKQRPYYRLPADTLATWIEQQPDDDWWFVDGDPWLTSVLDFPCPADELVKELRKVRNRDLLLLDKTPGSQAQGEVVDSEQLDNLADTKNRRKKRTFLLTWDDGSDIEWLLIQDDPITP